MAEPHPAEPSSVGEVVRGPFSVLRSRPVLAVLALLGAVLAAELVPALGRLSLLEPARAPAVAPELASSSALAPPAVGEAELVSESRGQAELAPGSERHRRASGPIAAEPLTEPGDLVDKEPPVALEDASGHALDGFFRALARTQKKESRAITRIVHYGDSIVASDYVSGMLRRRFQERFGDAGHGFSLIANAWPAYAHNDVERYATAGWTVSRVVGPLAKDGLYGLGCVSFRAEKNVLSRFGTAKSGDFGRAVSRFVVSYLREPGGGTFQLSLDGEPRALIDTAAETKAAASYELSAPDGAHELEIFTKSGRSRLFGVVMERDVAGVVLDAIGIQGARIRFLDQQDDAHFAEQLRWRNPDLLVYEFGANESADGFLYPMDEYHRTMASVLRQGRVALPDAGCLVIGAMDRASKRGETLISHWMIPHLIKAQRTVAAEVGCAFFDTLAAMGGHGAMPSWVKRGLGQADLTHPTAIGSNMIGTWIYRALMRRYTEFLAGAPSAAQAK